MKQWFNANKQGIGWAMVVMAIVASYLVGGLTYPIPAPPSDIQTMAEGDSNFTNVVASGDITAGDDITVGDTLTVNGDLDYQGDGFDVDTTGAISLDADAASNFNVSGASADLTLESEAGSLVLKGDEAVATGVTIDANDAVTTGVTIQVGSVSGLLVDGGVTNIGGGTPAVATGDNDLYVTADLEVDGEAEFDGAIDADSTANIQGAVTLQSTLDVASTINYGSGNLYPLGYASASREIVCGTTGTFTATTAVSVSGLTTITHAIVTQITDPASTGALVTVDAPTTSTLTVNSWETDATVGTTGVNVYYCAVGNE